MTLERKLTSALNSGKGERIEKAYSEIYQAYRGLLYFIAAKYGISEGDRDDIVSETFLSFFNYSSKSEVTSIKAFLVKAAENRCMDLLKSKDIEPMEEEAPTSERMSIVIEQLRSLLGQEDFSLLYDYCVYELGSEEIAKAKGSTPAAIRQRIKRIKEKARKLWEE